MYGYRNGSIKQYIGRQMVQPYNMQFKARKQHQKESLKYFQKIQTHDPQPQSQSTFECSTQMMLTK